MADIKLTIDRPFTINGVNLFFDDKGTTQNEYINIENSEAGCTLTALRSFSLLQLYTRHEHVEPEPDPEPEIPETEKEQPETETEQPDGEQEENISALDLDDEELEETTPGESATEPDTEPEPEESEPQIVYDYERYSDTFAADKLATTIICGATAIYPKSPEFKISPEGVLGTWKVDSKTLADNASTFTPKEGYKYSDFAGKTLEFIPNNTGKYGSSTIKIVISLGVITGVESTYEIKAGSTLTLNPIPSNVTITSNDSNVISVENKTLKAGRFKGSCTITVSAEGYSDFLAAVNVEYQGQAKQGITISYEHSYVGTPITITVPDGVTIKTSGRNALDVTLTQNGSTYTLTSKSYGVAYLIATRKFYEDSDLTFYFSQYRLKADNLESPQKTGTSVTLSASVESIDHYGSITEMSGITPPAHTWIPSNSKATVTNNSAFFVETGEMFFTPSTPQNYASSLSTNKVTININEFTVTPPESLVISMVDFAEPFTADIPVNWSVSAGAILKSNSGTSTAVKATQESGEITLTASKQYYKSQTFNLIIQPHIENVATRLLNLENNVAKLLESVNRHMAELETEITENISVAIKDKSSDVPLSLQDLFTWAKLMDLYFEMPEPDNRIGGNLDSYLDRLVANKYAYEFNLENYPWLSEFDYASFANFRLLPRTNCIFRSASPITDVCGRQEAVNSQIFTNWIGKVLNLSGDYDESSGISPYLDSEIKTYNAYIDITVDNCFFNNENMLRFGDGLKNLIADALPGDKILIHGVEGIFRTGFVVMLFSFLIDTPLNVVTFDYMRSYFNYYGLTADNKCYDTAVGRWCYSHLRNLFAYFEVEGNPTSVEFWVLRDVAERYLYACGLNNDEITKLKALLTNDINNEEYLPVGPSNEDIYEDTGEDEEQNNGDTRAPGGFYIDDNGNIIGYTDDNIDFGDIEPIINPRMPRGR